MVPVHKVDECSQFLEGHVLENDDRVPGRVVQEQRTEIG